MPELRPLKHERTRSCCFKPLCFRSSLTDTGLRIVSNARASQTGEGSCENDPSLRRTFMHWARLLTSAVCST